MTNWAPALKGRPAPLYEALAEAIAEDCARGRLKAGDQLPTHRELADRLGVTVGTVSRGYSEAARRGLLSGEVGRGTFVRGPGPEPASLADADAAFVDLGVNHPPASPTEAHARALSRSLLDLGGRADLARLLDYPLEGGHPAHRDAAATWIRRLGLDVRADQVLVCGGSQHGLMAALSVLLDPGDVLLVEELTYPGLKATANLLRLRLRPVALDGHGMRADALEEASRDRQAKAVYCVPTIQNPTASVMPADRRRALADVIRARGLALVEDDVHARLAEAPPPIASLVPEKTVYITSTSKTLAPGLRIGFIAAPPPLVGRLAAAIRATIWAAAPLMAEVVAGWIRDGTADALVAERRREAALRHDKARQLLAGARYSAHPNGYHLWLELPRGWRSEEFAAAARRRGVAVTAADAFLTGGPAPHAVRVCLGGPSSRTAVELGLQRVAETLASAPGEGLAIV